ncbi:MAG: tRNA (adenosine(37)-N6)-dimethylallyltransferase MiaA [Thermoleophilaceae bacterium]
MRSDRPLVFAIFGPTAVGKTEVALALADRLRGRGERPVAISADALQVYRGIETLTGVASPAERERLEHLLVSFVELDREFSVGEYMPLAHAAIDTALADGRTPLVVGGTGLYLRAALSELSLAPAPPHALRARLEQELASRGPQALHARLAERAPALARSIGPADRSRIVRALERAELGLDAPEQHGELWAPAFRRPTALFGLTMERTALYRRIDERVEGIVAAGAVREVHAAAGAGASRTARKALGFAELLEGDVEGMKRRSRNYAKRQLTWMRKLGAATLVDVTDRTPQAIAEELADGG